MSPGKQFIELKYTEGQGGAGIRFEENSKVMFRLDKFERCVGCSCEDIRYLDI